MKMIEAKGLVGRGFHTVDDDGATCWQGEVIADLGGGYFLVQLFSWLMGEDSTQHVLQMNEFATKTLKGEPRYRFFDNIERANEYMELRGYKRDEHIRKKLEKANGCDDFAEPT
jgi:hypothetical protein